MAAYGVGIIISYTAFNTSTKLGETGNVGNHTLKVVCDGVAADPDNTPSEDDDGEYLLELSNEEMQAKSITVRGVSSTSDVIIIPAKLTTHNPRPVISATSAGLSTINSSGKITLRKNNDCSVQITGLGSLAGRSQLLFAIKSQLSQDDSESILLVSESSNVLKINGETPVSSSGATITVNDEDDGDITIAFGYAVINQLTNAENLLYQVKVDNEEKIDDEDEDNRVEIRGFVIETTV